MTRVLMTSDTVGGVWTYSLELADALASYGVEVVLATMGRPLTDEQRDAVGRSAAVEVHESGFALEWMDEPWADVDRAAAWLLDLEDEVQPDVVHLNGYAHAALPWRVPVVVVAHSCVTSWWEAVHGTAPPPTWQEYARRLRAGLRNADEVVAPTAAMLDALRRCHAFEGGTVVPNSRRHDFVRPAVKAPMVLSAGRLWDEAKNVRVLDRVAPALGHRVVVAGDTGGASLHGAEWLGPLAPVELARWMSYAAVFALPARYEPFGLAALEAGLAACALVLGDIPSLREVWGDAASYVPPDDEDALAATLRSLLEDRAAAAEMGRRARWRALQYRPERTAAGYLRVYDRVRETVGSTR